ncbi:MAG: hypothetical protein IJC99_01570 [Clostridia bacterium]|nr:hypothetical protein [Clostridia bacterium]
MFKQKLHMLLPLFLLSLLLFGCGQKPDTLAPFRGAYFAELSGTLYGMEFAAAVEMTAASGGGTRAATVTFYAPAALAGTTVARNQAGEINITAGDVTLPDVGGVGAALFSLFPVSAEITETELTEEGHTRVCGEGFVLILLPDGTPYEIKTDAVSARVVRFAEK